VSALDDIRRALTEAYGTGVVLDGMTTDDLVKAAVAEFDLDAEAYPGELAMLRGLVRTLRVVVRPDTVDVDEVRRLLHQHVGDDAEARTESARQAALLGAIRKDPSGRWKSGRAVKALRQAGHHPISPSTASHCLAALAAAGHLIRHEETGVRWYEVTAPRATSASTTREDGRA
jgi:SpoVK/Ycf46/Vps4 family AAA+-type ATPase